MAAGAVSGRHSGIDMSQPGPGECPRGGRSHPGSAGRNWWPTANAARDKSPKTVYCMLLTRKCGRVSIGATIRQPGTVSSWWLDRCFRAMARERCRFMPINLSVRRAGAILGGLALAVGAIASTGPVALASTAKPNATAAALCKTDGSRVEGPADGVSLWYSGMCRTAWAVATDEPQGFSFYVTNIDSGAKQSATVQVTNQRTVTAAVDDAGTMSKACYTEVVLHNQLITICTAAF